MLTPGTVLGDRYRLIRRIGEGGMGTVFEAEHTLVGHRVAVKVLLPECARHPDVVERFEREAKAAGAIGHDGIVGVVDFGRFEELPYMVMEYLEGEDLADRLDRKGPMPIREAVWVLGEILSALSAAHAVGIVHRDLKPENIFLVRHPDGTDAVKVLDFGVSKFGSEESLGGRSLTKTGVLMGTPTYMAPEQALARRDVDFRADIYAAGVLLYEMLTNKLPYEAESQAELLMAIVYQKPPATPVRTHRTEIPEGLAAVIARAMNPDRDQRFQDPRDFITALRPFGATAKADPNNVPQFPKPSGSIPPPRKMFPSEEITSDLDPRASPAPLATAAAPRRGMFVGLLVIALAAFAGIAFAMRSAPSSGQRVVTPVRDPMVHVDLQNVPSEASVRVDGAPVSARAFSFLRHSTHNIEVNAPGSAAFQTSFVADRDRSVVIALTAIDPTLDAGVPVPAAPPSATPLVAPANAPDAGTAAPVVRAPARPHEHGRHRHHHNGQNPPGTPVEPTPPAGPETHTPHRDNLPNGVLTPTHEF